MPPIDPSRRALGSIAAVLVLAAAFACDREPTTAAPTEPAPVAIAPTPAAEPATTPAPTPTEPAATDAAPAPVSAKPARPAPVAGVACTDGSRIPKGSCASRRCADVPAAWTHCDSDDDCFLMPTGAVKCTNRMPFVSVSRDHSIDAIAFKEPGSCGCESARAVCVAGVCGVADS